MAPYGFVELRHHWYWLWMPQAITWTNAVLSPLNTLRPRQNDRHFPDDIFKCIFLFENVWIWIKISLKFVPKVRINNIPALVQIMAWRRIGDKPLSEAMMVNLVTHICVTRPQWVKHLGTNLLSGDLSQIQVFDWISQCRPQNVRPQRELTRPAYRGKCTYPSHSPRLEGAARATTRTQHAMITLMMESVAPLRGHQRLWMKSIRYNIIRDCGVCDAAHW